MAMGENRRFWPLALVALAALGTVSACRALGFGEGVILGATPASGLALAAALVCARARRAGRRGRLRPRRPRLGPRARASARPTRSRTALAALLGAAAHARASRAAAGPRPRPTNG